MTVAFGFVVFQIACRVIFFFVHTLSLSLSLCLSLSVSLSVSPSLSLSVRFIIPILKTQTTTLLLKESPSVVHVYGSSFSYQVRVGATCHALIVTQKSSEISMSSEDAQKR
jgi:hypothetical protein